MASEDVRDGRLSATLGTSDRDDETHYSVLILEFPDTNSVVLPIKRRRCSLTLP